MGRSTTPKHRIEFRDSSRKTQAVAWNTKWYGRANQNNLDQWVARYNGELELGGINDHISKALGFVPYITSAKIVNQKTDQTVAEYQMAMFQTI